jgi:hypothetical protein
VKRSRRADCPSRKVRYRDSDEAKKALSRIKATAGQVRHATPVRYYECGMCQGWHLTSQDHYESPRW